MYGFKKTVRSGDTLTFVHDIFWKGNEANFSCIERKSKPRAEKIMGEKFEKENMQTLDTIKNHDSFSESTKQTFISLLGYKERSVENIKKIKKKIERIIEILKDTRKKKVNKDIEDLKEFNTKEIEEELRLGKEIDEFIEKNILVQTKEFNSDFTNKKEEESKPSKKENEFENENDDLMNMHDDEVSIMGRDMEGNLSENSGFDEPHNPYDFN